MAAQWIPFNQKSNIQKTRQQAACHACPIPPLLLRQLQSQISYNLLFTKRWRNRYCLYLIIHSRSINVTGVLDGWLHIKAHEWEVCQSRTRQLLAEKLVWRYKFVNFFFLEQNKFAPPDVSPALQLGFWLGLDIQILSLDPSLWSMQCTIRQKCFSASENDARLDGLRSNRLNFQRGTSDNGKASVKL